MCQSVRVPPAHLSFRGAIPGGAARGISPGRLSAWLYGLSTLDARSLGGRNLASLSSSPFSADTVMYDYNCKSALTGMFG